MKTIRILQFALAAAVSFAAGCGKETFSDPRAFAEKYVKPDVLRCMGGDLGKWGFKDVEICEASTSMEEATGLLGLQEVVTCCVRLVPASGVRHYCLLNWKPSGYEGGEEAADKVHQALRLKLVSIGFKTNALSATSIEDVIKKADCVNGMFWSQTFSNVVKPPVGSPFNDFDKEITAKVVRAKDGEGIYHPVAVGISPKVMVRYSSRKFPFNQHYPEKVFGDILLTEDVFKKWGGVALSDEKFSSGILARETMRKAEEFASAYRELYRLLEQYEDLAPDKSWSTFRKKKYDEISNAKVKPANAELQAAYEVARSAKRLAERDIRGKTSALNHAKNDLRSAQGSLAKIEERLYKAEARLEVLRRKVAEFGNSTRNQRQQKRAASDLANCESNIADLKVKREETQALIKKCDEAVAQSEKDIEEAKVLEQESIAESEAHISKAKVNLDRADMDRDTELTVAIRDELARLKKEIESRYSSINKIWDGWANSLRSVE